jgi:hypothetical protein
VAQEIPYRVKDSALWLNMLKIGFPEKEEDMEIGFS